MSKQVACAHCGKTLTGGDPVGKKRYCWNKECQKAAKRHRNKLLLKRKSRHQQKGLCIFRLPDGSFCVKKGASFCPEHQEVHCAECSQQATHYCLSATNREALVFEEGLCDRPLCDTCTCSGVHMNMPML